MDDSILYHLAYLVNKWKVTNAQVSIFTLIENNNRNLYEVKCVGNKLWSNCIFRYDHLSNTLTKILDERPENVYDIFEDISKDSKRSRFTSNVDTVQDKLDQSTEVALAQVQRKLFAVSIYFICKKQMYNFFVLVGKYNLSCFTREHLSCLQVFPNHFSGHEIRRKAGDIDIVKNLFSQNWMI